MNILLVDDEAVILKSLGRFLKWCGHQVYKARNGSDALCLLDRNAVDLVVSDIRMPKMTGLELLETIGGRHPGLPVVLMTGHGDVDSAINALKQGAIDYLRKPVKLDDVVAILDRIEHCKNLETSLSTEREIPDEPPERAKESAVGIVLKMDAPRAAIQKNLKALQRLWDRVFPTLELLEGPNREDLHVFIHEMPGLISDILEGAEQMEHLVIQARRLEDWQTGSDTGVTDRA